MATVYKVVRLTDGKLCSATTGSIPDSIAVTYKPFEKQYPSVGHLFAYATRAYAVLDWHVSGNRFGLWVAEAKTVVSAITRLPRLIYSSKRDIIKFWRGEEMSIKEMRDIPAGTVFCEWIELRRPIL